MDAVKSAVRSQKKMPITFKHDAFKRFDCLQCVQVATLLSLQRNLSLR